MSRDPARRRPARARQPAPALAQGTVKVRLLGGEPDVEAVASMLGDVTIERSRPYENREDPGVRVYLTLRIGGA